VPIRLLIEKEQIEAFHLFPGEETIKTGVGNETNLLDILRISDTVFAKLRKETCYGVFN
jgi:hypothetical protein